MTVQTPAARRKTKAAYEQELDLLRHLRVEVERLASLAEAMVSVHGPQDRLDRVRWARTASATALGEIEVALRVAANRAEVASASSDAF